MILDYNRFKPIKTFGTILTVAGIFVALALFAEFRAPKVDEGGIIFLSIMAIWHLASGLGILLRKMWGFKLMKVYLYIMYLGIPLGTLLARKILSYITSVRLRIKQIQLDMSSSKAGFVT